MSKLTPINIKMLHNLKVDTIKIDSVDVCGGKAGRGNWKKRKMKVSDTAGLEEQLLVGKHCRVMIRRNLDVGKRLMNGSLGTVTDIVYGSGSGGKRQVETLEVLIDGIEQPVKIQRVKGQFMVAKNVTNSKSVSGYFGICRYGPQVAGIESEHSCSRSWS